SDKYAAEVRKIFKKSLRRAQVYLAANGQHGVEEIAAYLRMKRQNVGRELKFLAEEGLLEIFDTAGGRAICATKSLDKTVRISKYLCKEFSLSHDGRPMRGPHGKARKKRR